MTFINISKAKKENKVSYLGGFNLSAKLIKNKKVSNVLTYSIYLSPASLSGYNVCKHSTNECRIGCLNTSGRARMEVNLTTKPIENARNIKTKLFHENNNYFMNWLVAEMKLGVEKAKRLDIPFSARLNCTSDINWADAKLNGFNVFEMFPDVIFYDYTKDYEKMINNTYKNNHLTFSYSGKNFIHALNVLENKKNVAVVFDVKKGEKLPDTFMGFPVIDGDITDYRPNDGEGVVVGLRWKRIADKIAEKKVLNSIFVVKPNDEKCKYNVPVFVEKNETILQ